MYFNFLISAIFCLFVQIAAVGATQSVGCGKPMAASLTKGGVGKSNSVNFTTSDGVQRTFLLHIPTEYDTEVAAPLIFSFHGRSEDGAMQEGLSQLSNELWNPSSFVVYPDGIDQQWEGDPASVGVDDVGFVLDMIASLENEFCIDSSRIYSSGFSNGAGFSTNILACNSSATAKIAAFMGASAAAYQGTTDVGCVGATVPITCNPGRSLVPVLETHGSADGVINYYGGPRRGRCLPAIPHFVTEWAKRNGLTAANTSTSLYGGNVTKFEFGASSKLTGLVTHYWVSSMGHTWPTSGSTWFDATPLVLAWFNKYTLGSVAATSAATSRASSSISTQPSSTHINSATPSAAQTGKISSSMQSSSYSDRSSSTSLSKLSTSTSKSSTSTSRLSTSTSKSSTSTSRLSTSTSKSSTSTSKYSTSVSSPNAAHTSLCPTANGTVYTDSNDAKYEIYCAFDTTNQPITSASYPGSFVKCMELCDITLGCESLAYNGACYLKGAVTKFIPKSSNLNRVAVRVG